MISETDLWVIQSLIESKTGSTGRLYVSGEEDNILLSFITETKPAVSVPKERKFNVFLVEQGVPDLFTIIGFQTPVVCYHLNYVGKFIKFRSFIMNDPQDGSINSQGTANLFELLSALYFQAGNEAFATTCLLQSIIESQSRVPDKDVYEELNYELHSSYYGNRVFHEYLFTLLYFGFAHELGHTYGDDCLEVKAKVHPMNIGDRAIMQAVVESAKTAFKEIDPDGDDFFDSWYQSYQTTAGNKTSVFNTENLRSEILADFIGFNILIGSINALAGFGHQQVNLKIIVSETIVGLFVIQLMEALKYIVTAMPNPQSDPQFQSRYFPFSVNDGPLHLRLNSEQMIQDFQIAYKVRWEFLKPSLSTIVLSHLFPDTFAIQHGAVTITCSEKELDRRQAIATDNLENYLSFYTREMLKLQSRLADVIHFAAHLATGKIPEERASSPAQETFAAYIEGNFQIYLDRLETRDGLERKREILQQLSVYHQLLEKRNKKNSQSVIEKFIHRLESDVNRN